ncbi:hypothetical protein [Providencia sp. wls1921]|uniref:hypothetical protein n=1 Tax=Providencia sp. wls1921 TaxID=2675153 RepID=UPI0012B5C419|nr:hypothetical protein [Providencia sp. wls1921]MTC43611.1 hypothetical protein [Providencia sp. wls1921]
MKDVMTQEIDDALEWAEKLKEASDEFIGIADGINNAERIRLEEERGIDIDSTQWVSLDDIPLGEEVLRVKEDTPNLDIAIQTLEDLAGGKILDTEFIEKFQEAIDDLNTFNDTLQDVGAEEVIKAYQVSDDNDFYHEKDEEYGEEEDE